MRPPSGLVAALARIPFFVRHMLLQALYVEGGIYLDTDVEVIKSFALLICWAPLGKPD